MFDKPSFKASARKKRCMVLVDGFFEYHWKGNRSFPYFIQLKNREPMMLAGLWETWKHPKEDIIRQTFAIVTGAANPLMSGIHNKPKASEGPRMPVILLADDVDKWLLEDELTTPQEISKILNLVRPLDEKWLEAYPVARLKGKEGVGNSVKAIERVDYPELS
jgi:putative SOS response-associated peptidase YedK